MRYIDQLSKNQSGQGLLAMTIFLLLIIFATTAIILVITITENNAYFLEQDKRRALMAATAGVEDACIMLVRNPTNPCVLGCETDYNVPVECVTDCAKVNLAITPLSGSTATITSTGNYGFSTRKFLVTLTFDSNRQLTGESWVEQ